MRPGRKPLPTAAKRLAGNPGKRALRDDEPDLTTAPAAEFDATPLELGDDAVAIAEWARLAPILRGARVLTDGDRGSLVALCQQWSRYLDSIVKIGKSGMVIKSPSGYPMPNPYIAIGNTSLKNCLKLWAELGLTPSARSRVAAAPLGTAGPHDPFAEFDEVRTH